MKLRSSPDRAVIPFDSAVPEVRSAIDKLMADIASKVTPVEYNG
jgi:hypothetical protein